jgi:ribosome assembly protein YihI (activator of Der GTPase)
MNNMTNADFKKLFAEGKTAADIKKMVEAAEREYNAEQEQKKNAAAKERKAKVRSARAQLETSMFLYINALSGEPVSKETQQEVKDYLDHIEELVERLGAIKVVSTREKENAGSDSWINDFVREYGDFF